MKPALKSKHGPDVLVIYALCDPMTGEARYIGKADNASKRLLTHIRDSWRRRTPVCDWVKSLSNRGLRPEMRVIEEVTGQWEDRERAIIAEHRAAGVRLLNLADGGDQPKSNPDQLKRACLTMNRKVANHSEFQKKVHQFKRFLQKDLTVARRDGDTRAIEHRLGLMRKCAASHPHIFPAWVGI